LVVDPKWFQRILDNLIANAIKHNPDDTHIYVRVRQFPDYFTIEVEDNGLGMDEEMKKKIFDRYYRGINTDERKAGTGLGMAIAKQLAETHGGRLNMESKAGKGTKLWMIFPLN
jgi:signal transduction histidine kinase